MSDDPFGDMFRSPTAPAERPTAPAPVQTSPSNDPFGDMFKDGAKPLDEKPEQGPAPSWLEIPGKAAGNFGPDAVEVAKNIGHAIIHPIESAQNLGSIGLGYMEKAGRHAGLPSGQGYEQYADAMNKMVMDNYGSVDNFKKTLAEHPAQALMDISAVMTGGGSLGAKLPGIAGKVGEGVAAAGSAIDPLNVIAKPVMAGVKGTSALLKHGVGERTGVGPEALGAAYEAGFKGGEPATAFRENLRQQTPIETPVRDAMQAMDNIVSDKNTGYQQGIAQAGLDRPISASSFRKILDGIQKASDIGHQKGFVIDPAAMKANADLGNMVGEFLRERPDFHTVQGLDALKQAIGVYRDTQANTGRAGIVANHYYHSVLDAIKQQAPAYAQVMENYSEAKGLITQLQKSFSLPANERQLNIDTALRKLQSVMRNNANSNYGFRKTLMENLEQNGAPSLTYQLAGQALSSKTPRGISKVAAEKGGEIAAALFGLFTGNPALMAGAIKAGIVTYATSTPRLVGEQAYYAGKIAKPLSKVLNRPVARVLNQAGKPYTGPNLGPLQGEARGGAVDKALRLTKRGV